jgi:DNA ligase-1
VIEDEEEDEVMEDAPEPEPKKAKTSSPKSKTPRKKDAEPTPIMKTEAEEETPESASEVEEEELQDEEEKPEVAAKARQKVQASLKSDFKHPYPDWKAGEPVPYAALCKTFSLIELTTKRLEIMAHCALFLRQVLRLTPDDLLPTVLLMINKLAPDYAGIELGIGESLIMKAIGESTGRSLAVIKQDQKEIGDLGLVAVKSRSTQPTMFKPKPLTIRGVHKGLMAIATLTGNGAQGRKVDSIKKLLSAADANGTGKVDITKDKGGPSEAKYLIRFLEGKLRLGLAEKTVIVSLAQAMVAHEAAQKGKVPSTDDIAKGESILKTVYRYVLCFLPKYHFTTDELTKHSELPSYDVIIPAMVEHGIQNLREHCKLRPGVPLKPMLAKPTKAITEVLDRFEGQTFTCEYKYDGERAQIHYVANDTDEELSQSAMSATKEVGKGVAAIFSRNSEDLSKKYPDVLAKLPSWVKEDTKSFVLDCESVAWDVQEKKVLPFQQLMTRKKKDVKVEDVKVKVCVFAFDLLYLNGEAVVEKSLRERRELLHKAFQPVEGEFAFATSMDGQELDEIQTFLDESVKASCEGLMVKMLDGEESGYEPSKRSRNWLKVCHRPQLSNSKTKILTQIPDQKRLPLRHRRLPRPRRPRRLPRQGKAHLRLRRLPARLLQPGHGHVRDGLQHRHGLQRGRARGAARFPVPDRHRPAQAVLRAQLRRAAPARRLVRAAVRVGGQDGRPDAQPALQGGHEGGGRSERGEGNQFEVSEVY